MHNLGLLILLLVVGFAARRGGRLPSDAATTINALIVQMAMPALIFCNIQPITLRHEHTLVAVMPWLLFLASLGLFVLLGLLLGWSRQTVGTLAVTAGFGNLSFIGLPLIEAFYGTAWLGVGVIGAQIGVNIATNTLGVLTAAYCGQGAAVSFSGIARRILRYPPFQAFVLALALQPLTVPESVMMALGRIGALVAPLAMLSIGLQLGTGERLLAGSAVLAGLAVKLMLAPALAFAIIYSVLEMTGELARIVVFQAAIGPQVAGAIVAAEFKLDTRLSALIVGMGTVVSLLSVLVWHSVAANRL